MSRALGPILCVLLVGCASVPHRYPVPPDVGRLVVDGAAFAGFAREVRAGLAAAPGDLETRKKRLFVLALLDALDDQWVSAVADLDALAALETSADARIMTGLTIRVWADARPGDPHTFRGALERRLAAMPVERLHEPLQVLRAMGQVFTPDACRKLLEDAVGAEARGGTVGLDGVHAIAFQRYAVVLLVPVGKDIDEVLAAAGIP